MISYLLPCCPLLSSNTSPPTTTQHNTRMGLVSMSTRPEEHVLKLVHPGGLVELHTNPVMASQVMKNNPRHCVTRPDFFHFPWIVVSPQSLLTPGNVFFIVPYHTIRTLLLKSTTTNTSNSLPLPHALNPPINYCHRDREHCNKVSKCFIKQPSCVRPTTSRDKHKHCKGTNKSSIIQSRVRAYSSQCAPCHAPPSFTHSQLNRNLKPCLKKDNARSRNLKVSFDHNVNYTFYSNFIIQP